MDPETITAITGTVTAAGLAAGFFIKRADARRQRREELLIAHLTKQIEEINAKHKEEIDRIRSDHAAEVHRLRGEVLHERRLRHLVQKDATHWREQLIENHIDPDPADWTELIEEVQL